jgi:hypothetical protein
MRELHQLVRHLCRADKKSNQRLTCTLGRPRESEDQSLPDRKLIMDLHNLLTIWSCWSPAHTLPAVELKWSKVHIDLYTHSTVPHMTLSKTLDHKFVESTKRDYSLQGTRFEWLV